MGEDQRLYPMKRNLRNLRNLSYFWDKQDHIVSKSKGINCRHVP